MSSKFPSGLELEEGELKIGGVAVTPSAANLNILKDLTSTAAELNTIHSSGVTNADLVKLHAITKTAAQVNTMVAGAAAGYKIAHGVATIGAATEDVATGLATVTNVFVTMVGDPSMTHSYSTATIGNQTNAPVAGSIRIKSWKPTAANDCTPIPAATVFSNVAWIAIGT